MLLSTPFSCSSVNTIHGRESPPLQPRRYAPSDPEHPMTNRQKRKNWTFAAQSAIQKDGSTLKRIQAQTDIPEHGIREGDLGGYVAKAANLPRGESAWVADEACVYESAVLKGRALVRDGACVRGNALVAEKAIVEGSAQVYGEAVVFGSAVVTDNARVYEGARAGEQSCIADFAQVHERAFVTDNAAIKKQAVIRGDALIADDACVTDGAQVSGHASVLGNAFICDDAQVSGAATISQNAMVCHNAKVSGNAMLHGNARVEGNSVVCGDAVLGEGVLLQGEAEVTETRDYVLAGPMSATARLVCAHLDREIGIRVSYGEFSGSVSECKEYVESEISDIYGIRSRFLATLTYIEACLQDRAQALLARVKEN